MHHALLPCSIAATAMLLTHPPSSSAITFCDDRLHFTPLQHSQNSSVCRFSHRVAAAGQGYIWMAHRNPMDEPCWQLAQASNQLWRNSMLPDAGQAHLNPTELQWQVSLCTS